MGVMLNPYLAFDGTARRAMEFYQQVLGGALEVMTFGDLGDRSVPNADGVMHAQLKTPSGFLLMAADMPPGEPAAPPTHAYSVSLSGDQAHDLTAWWEGLSDGGTVHLPLGKQVWGDVFGHCTDKFGTSWMVNIAGSSV